MERPVSAIEDNVASTSAAISGIPVVRETGSLADLSLGEFAVDEYQPVCSLRKISFSGLAGASRRALASAFVAAVNGGRGSVDLSRRYTVRGAPRFVACTLFNAFSQLPICLTVARLMSPVGDLYFSSPSPSPSNVAARNIPRHLLCRASERAVILINRSR